MRKRTPEGWPEPPRTVMACGEWAQTYMDFAEARFSHKTYDEKRSVFQRFFKLIDQQLAVTDLTRAKVMAYVKEQKEGRSGCGANKDRKNLVAAWNWGMKYLDPPLPGPNPCLVERMPEERQRRHIPPVGDFWRVYDVCEDGQDKVMLLTYLYTAARRGEVFNLRWEDVDFGGKQIRFYTRKRMDGTLEADWIPLADDLFHALLEHRKVSKGDWVFLNPAAGLPFVARRRWMRGLCERAGVRSFGLHAIRHLTASILADQGVAAKTIQAILRHKNLSTTERYLHLLEDLRPALRLLPSARKKPSGEPSSSPERLQVITAGFATTLQ
ncbi:tyrosine-type recombinase/integrase [Thermodesulfobacteriota bacterium]